MMSKKLNIILSASSHLPSGTGEPSFEALYDNEIKPLVSALNKFPRINMVFHYSGVVLYWIERRHPEFFMLLEDLLSRKQAEFLGGGFYSPMLPLLPMADKIGQIEMLTTYLRKHFGRRPQGCWLPAMAWEQNLVGPLNSCGMSYTFLEDLQFTGAGVKPAEGGIFFPCITEDQGKLITVFPVAGALGRGLWKDRPAKTLGDLCAAVTAAEPVLVLPVGDGPGKDYDKLFEELSGADAKIEFTTPAKVIKNLNGLKKAYFSGVWASGENGNYPRRFLSDHPEAGGIYAKMIYVHTLINNQLRGDKTRKRTALEELWKAQDSGIFRMGSAASPGFLHSPVRKAAYRSLLEAEKITREKRKFSPSLSVFDFDLDGEGEYVFQDEKLNCCIKSRGAGIFELDYLPCAWNYLDTLAPGVLEGAERRCSFVDWLAPAGSSVEDLEPGGVRGGSFFGNVEYEATETDRVHRRLTFTLPVAADSPWQGIEIIKTWQLKKSSLALEYQIKNTGTKAKRFTFCPQIDLSFPGEGEGFVRVLVQKEDEKETVPINETPAIRNVRTLEFQDFNNEAVISLEASRGFDGRIFQIRAGLAGQEEYQSTCVMPLLPVSLEGGKSWKVSFSLRISS